MKDISMTRQVHVAWQKTLPRKSISHNSVHVVDAIGILQDRAWETPQNREFKTRFVFAFDSLILNMCSAGIAIVVLVPHIASARDLFFGPAR